MMKSVVEEAMALASISLFLAMVAVWTQVLGVLWVHCRRVGRNLKFLCAAKFPVCLLWAVQCGGGQRHSPSLILAAQGIVECVRWRIRWPRAL